MFAAATSDATSAQRRTIALYIALFAVLFLAFFHVTGLELLRFFGISLPAFRIAGGGVSDASDEGYARRRFEKLLVPFAMPLLIGPGAISTVIIQAGEAQAHG